MNRSLLLAALVLLAGCSANGGGSTPVSASGEPVTVGEDALAETGYEHRETVEQRLNATLRVTLSGDVEVEETQAVNATIPVARYERTTDRGPVVLSVASSPSVRLVENPPESADPLGTLPTPELATFLQSTYRDVADLSETDRTRVAVVGAETDLVTYEGSAVRDGQRVPVTVHVARATREDDVVTAVAVTPRAADERDRIRRLLRAI